MDAQKSRLICNAKNQGYTDLKVYQDIGFSGLNMERPAFKQMLADIESGKIDMVMSASMSRFSRDPFRLHGFVNSLKTHNVGINTMDKSHEYLKLHETLIENMRKDMNKKRPVKAHQNRHDR